MRLGTSQDTHSRVWLIVTLVLLLILALTAGAWLGVRSGQSDAGEPQPDTSLAQTTGDARASADSSSKDATPPPPPDADAQEVSVDEVRVDVTVAGGGEAALPDGTVVSIPAGAVSEDTHLLLSRSRLGAPQTSAGLVPAGSPVWIELESGELTGAARLVLPTRPPNSSPEDLDFEPWPACFDESGEEWVPQPGEYDRSSGTLVMQVEHFSWWNPFSWDYAAIRDSMVQSLADMAGAPSGIPPTCATPPPTASVTLTTEGEPVTDPCLDTDGDQVILRMRGVKHYPLLVTWSGQALVAARSEYELDVTSLYRWLTERLGLTAADSVVLPAGGDIHLKVAPDGTAPVLATATYDASLQLIGIVDATTRVIMAVRSATGVATAQEEVWSLMVDTACFSQHIDDLGEDTAGAAVTIIAGCAGDVFQELAKSSSKMLLRVAGMVPKLIGAFVGVVLYAGHAVLAEFYTAADVLTGRTTQWLTVRAATSPTPDGSDSDSSPRSEPRSPWPTEANEGPPALWAWFGASFVLPDWVSCDEAVAWCIAGIGREVHIMRIDGLRDMGSVPLATTDPTASLVAKGLPAATVAELLAAE